MGSLFDATCRECGTVFQASHGHGRRFQELRCDACGEARLIRHDEIAGPLRRFRRAGEVAGDIDDMEEGDRAFERARSEFEGEVEAFAGECSCGGRFCYDAPLRCPSCRSTDLEQGKVRRLYD